MSSILSALGYGADLLIFLAGAALFFAGALGRLGAAVVPALAVVPGWTFAALRWVGLCGVLYGGGGAWLRSHDADLQRGWAASQRQAAAADLASAYARGQEVADERRRQEVAALAASAPVIREIRVRARSDACAIPPSDAAALDELRRRAGSGGR